MAVGTKANFVIYQEEFFGGYSEALEQNSNIFNAASQGAITIEPNRLKGDYEKESFVKNISNLITRRNVTSVADATDSAMTQDEFIGVKVNRKIGPVANTLDSFRKIASDPQEMSFLLGEQVGKASAVDMADTAARVLVAAITALGSGALHDGTAGTPTHTGLIDILSKMGDGERNVVAWMMHSKSYFDLMRQAVADKVFEVAGVTIYTGTVATLNRPVIVVDSSPLITSGTPDQYNILGLTRGACTIAESEQQEIVSDMVTGKENLIMRIQGEYAYNMKVRGMKWDVTNGGANPDDAALALSTNWDSVMAAANGIKAGPGARGLFD